jgi:cyclic pyranopterin phosphate synthase
MTKFSHVGEKGKARMVDITAKKVTHREAVAHGKVLTKPATAKRIEEMTLAKGDVLSVARTAGIMAAKKTWTLIPLCHPLGLTDIDIDFTIRSKKGEIDIEARAKTAGRTGVEMEAMTAVAVAALTIYDMCKSADREISISDIKLMKKKGGKSGTFRRKD